MELKETLRIGAAKWFDTWEQVPEEKEWHVTLLYRYWQAARMLWDSPPEESGFPSPVKDLFYRACDMLQMRPPVTYAAEEGLARLALVCERLIAAKPESVHAEAGISSFEAEGIKLDKLEKLQEAHTSNAIAGLSMLAERLFINPAEAPCGIGEVVRWHDARARTIAQAVEAQREVVEQEIARWKAEALRERLKPFRPFDPAELPRYTKHKFLGAARPAGEGWTNGHIIDLLGTPPWIRRVFDAGADKLLSPPERSLRYFVNEAGKATTKAVPALMYIDGNKRLVGLKYTGGYVFVDALYWMYFQRERKGSTPFVNAKERTPFVFFKDDAGNLVGVVAPFRMDMDAAERKAVDAMARDGSAL